MVGQTDFSGRLIERKQPLLINFYESWHVQNTQKPDARNMTGILFRVPKRDTTFTEFDDEILSQK